MGEIEIKRARFRDDFIRRLFAVAISVGFASTLVSMNWLKDGNWPNAIELEQIAILIVGLAATVLSWDGYLLSIDKKPLYDLPRFLIDIVLVFIYLFLLLSARQPSFFLSVLACIFTLYVVWDFLTVRLFVHQYRPADSSPHSEMPAKLSDVFDVYRGALVDRNDIGSSPIVTILWWLYFLALLIISSRYDAPYEVFVTCGFALLGLIGFRYDKSRRKQGAGKFRPWRRFIFIGAFIVILYMYFSPLW